MDPGLWEMLEGDAGEEIEAIVRLQARDRMPPGLRLVAQFGEVATCRLPRSAILSARADEAVESLKAPRLLVGEPKIVELEPEGLSPESRAAANQRRPPSLAVTGRGVVVGIADWGCDFAHPDFCHNDGTTRLEALWDQRSSGDHAANRYGYGTIYTADEINRALRAEDPYAALGYHPAGGDPLGTGSHGTHVMGIAAGNGRAGGPEGVAPEADLVFVHLATGGPEGEANLGDSVRILEAIDFILGTADGRPCAINLSVGRTGGDKTGTSLVEQWLDAAVGAAPGRAIAQSAGNYYNQRMHTFAQLRPGEKRTFVWHTDRADVTPNELELWYPGRDVLSVELHSPDGAHSWRAAQGEQAPLTIGEQKVGMIYHRTFDPNNGDHHVDLFLYPEAPAGDWEVTVTGEDVVDGRTHGYVERDAACPSCQSRFDPLDAVPSSTTGTICNGYRTIAVGAYDPYSPDGELAPFSSGGPTRDGRQKPDLVAPGVSVLAPRSAPRDPGDEVPMYTVKSGTSMAAPHVTGTLALIFEAAGKPLPIADTRRLLLSGTRSVDATPGMAARIGSGYLDIERAVEATRAFTDEEQLWPGETAPVAVGQEGAHPVAGPEVAARQALYAEPQMQPDHTSFTDQSDGFSDPVETPHATTGPSDHERETKTEAVVNWEQESAWPGESEDRLLEEEDAESLDLFDLGDGLLEEEEDDGGLEMQDLLEYEDDEAIDEEVYPYAQSMEMSLVDLADEAVSTGGNQGSPGALLEQVLSRAGIMETLSPLGPGSHGFTSPAVIFDAFAFGGIPALRDHFEQFLQVVAEPGSVMESDLRPGDLLIRRALGEGGLGHVAVVAAPEMWSYGQARSVGLIPESDRPAEYVQVVEGGARPHTLSDGFARRILDEEGRAPYDQMILRPRMPAGDGGLNSRVFEQAAYEQQAQDLWATVDSTGNVLVFPPTAAPTQSGPLAARQGGLVTDARLRPRMSIIVGPGATLRGIAARLLPLYAGAASGQGAMAPPTVDQLAQGLLVYNRLFLPVPAMTNYRDGLRLPLPIEIDQTSGAWVLNANLIRTWAARFQRAWQGLLDRRPQHLGQPDPALLAQQARRLLRARTTNQARGIHLQARALTNAFEAVFLVFKVFSEAGNDAFAIALSFMDSSVSHQINLLASLTAGNSIVHLISSILGSPPANQTAAQQRSLARARRMLAQALVPGGHRALPRELPETAQQLANRPGGVGPWQAVRQDDPRGARHRMVLGRDVLAGRVGTFTQQSGARFRGPAYGGRMPPAAFIRANRNLLNPNNDPQRAARLQIVRAIAVNEGFLDAVRMQDRGILSAGMQQWSAHADLELPGLLWRFKRMSPEEYYLFFGMYNLDVRRRGQDAHGNPRYRLQAVQPNGTRRDLATWQERKRFFGGTTSGNLTTFRTDWAARVREAAIGSEKFRAAQVLEAVARFDRVLRDVGSITISGNPVPVNRLITSDLGVALIVDAHINKPAHVRNDLQRAANAAGPQPNANALDQAITNRYAAIRNVHDRRNRNANINAQGLSANHGSFAGW